MAHEEWKLKFLDQCRSDREEALESIKFWERPGALIGNQMFGEKMKDVTAEHIADLHRIVANMDRLIAAIEAKDA